MLLHRLALLAAVLAFALVAFQAACGGDPPPSERPDAGLSDDSGLDRGVCPDAAPDGNSACTLPEGTTCSFAECGAAIAQCTRGAWRYAKNPPPRPPCPSQVPGIDESCPSCWPESQTCRYGSTNCALEDASDNTAIAACEGGKWTVEFRPCRDASTDVQGDAGADGD